MRPSAFYQQCIARHDASGQKGVDAAAAVKQETSRVFGARKCSLCRFYAIKTRKLQKCYDKIHGMIPRVANPRQAEMGYSPLPTNYPKTPKSKTYPTRMISCFEQFCCHTSNAECIRDSEGNGLSMELTAKLYSQIGWQNLPGAKHSVYKKCANKPLHRPSDDGRTATGELEKLTAAKTVHPATTQTPVNPNPHGYPSLPHRRSGNKTGQNCSYYGNPARCVAHNGA